MKTTSRNRDAFTLVELLIVISIIAILAGLVASAAGFVQKKGARSRAQAEISAMQAALENFKADNGDYPPNPQGNAAKSSVLVTNLMPGAGGGKVYYQFKPKSLDTNNNPLDPFGYPYNYVYDTNSGAPNNGSNNYDLWSTAGSPANSNSWIKNW
jgi:type II secretion system protein G